MNGTNYIQIQAGPQGFENGVRAYTIIGGFTG